MGFLWACFVVFVVVFLVGWGGEGGGGAFHTHFHLRFRHAHHETKDQLPNLGYLVKWVQMKFRNMS